MLTRSFLETAASPKYRQNFFHTALFNHHVIQDQDWPDPGIPPYYSKAYMLQCSALKCSYILKFNLLLYFFSFFTWVILNSALKCSFILKFNLLLFIFYFFIWVILKLFTFFQPSTMSMSGKPYLTLLCIGKRWS